MASSAVYTKRPSSGILIYRSTGVDLPDWTGGDGWELIHGVTGDIQLPGGTPAKVDITTHEDVLQLGAYRQNGAGLADTRDLAFDLLLDPFNTQHQNILVDVGELAVRDYRIVFPNMPVGCPEWGVRGQVGVEPTGPLGNYLRSRFTVLANSFTFNIAAAALNTTTTAVLVGAETVVPVVSTTGFTPTGSILLDGSDLVTYTALTATTFTGCAGVLAHASGVIVTQA